MKSFCEISLMFLCLCTAPNVPCQSLSLDSTSYNFPLALGDEWYYSVFNANFTGNHYTYETTIKVDSDTTMPNGKLYFQLSAMEDYYSHPVHSKIYLRKLGAQVYQYFPGDSLEYLRFDFSASIGDTLPALSFDPYSGLPAQYTTRFVLANIESLSCLGIRRTTYNFIVPKSIPISTSLVADSIGIIQQEDGFASQWTLFGARLNGKQYGTMLAVANNPATIPTDFRLYQNYPNPFNPSTILPFDLAQDEHVRLSVFDCLGRELLILSNGFVKAGHHEIPLNAYDLASGVYFYRITSGMQSITRRMLLMK